MISDTPMHDEEGEEEEEGQEEDQHDEIAMASPKDRGKRRGKLL